MAAGTQGTGGGEVVGRLLLIPVVPDELARALVMLDIAREAKVVTLMRIAPLFALRAPLCGSAHGPIP
jgi:hypothetical protein